MGDAHHHSPPTTPVEDRVVALESLLVEKGIIDPAALDTVVEYYEHGVGPMNGAKVVARVGVDDAFRERLLADGTAAIAELGFSGPEGDHMVVVENTLVVHNVVVCTLCSCYPWPVLGLPPNWYKSAPYRSRMVREPRVLLEEMGCTVPEARSILVWDSSADHLAPPMRPEGSDGLREDELAGLVTRDAMIGVSEL